MRVNIRVRRRRFARYRRILREASYLFGQGWLLLFARGHRPVGAMTMTQAAMLLKAGYKVPLVNGGELEMVNGRVIRVDKIRRP